MKLLATITTIALIGLSQTAAAATLKDVATVTGDVLTLGDLFHDAGENAGYVLGPAPQPGKDMILGARSLYRIASSLNVAWKPATTEVRIVVTREATLIGIPAVESALKDSLRATGIAGEFNVLPAGGIQPIILPHGTGETVEVSSIAFNPLTDTFDATLAAPSSQSPVKTMRVNGKVERLVAVPVLKSALRHGDVIGMGDIDTITLPAAQVKGGIILKSEDLAGMTPRRTAFAGKPLLPADLESPILVGRGDTVNITFREGSLLLTAKGKALQQGAKGDMVRVANMDSNKSVDARVTGTGEVAVR